MHPTLHSQKPIIQLVQAEFTWVDPTLLSISPQGGWLVLSTWLYTPQFQNLIVFGLALALHHTSANGFDQLGLTPASVHQELSFLYCGKKPALC